MTAASGQQSLSSSVSQSAVTLHRVVAFCFMRSRLFEIANVLVRFDQVASNVFEVSEDVPRRFVTRARAAVPVAHYQRRLVRIIRVTLYRLSPGNPGGEPRPVSS
jgi:hypothetical protein